MHDGVILGGNGINWVKDAPSLWNPYYWIWRVGGMWDRYYQPHWQIWSVGDATVAAVAETEAAGEEERAEARVGVAPARGLEEP